MNFRKFNWHIWAGLILSIIAFLSYPFVFVNLPLTRDFPWANLILFMIAVGLLFVGVRRAFVPDKTKKSKIAVSVAAAIGILVLGVFIYVFFIMARQLPAAQGAPRVGNRAPEFTLADMNGKPTSLTELRSQPISVNNTTVQPKGVLLIFYRGYW